MGQIRYNYHRKRPDRFPGRWSSGNLDFESCFDTWKIVQRKLHKLGANKTSGNLLHFARNDVSLPAWCAICGSSTSLVWSVVTCTDDKNLMNVITSFITRWISVILWRQDTVFCHHLVCLKQQNRLRVPHVRSRLSYGIILRLACSPFPATLPPCKTAF